MKLWLISQGIRNGYDTFDSMVVAARTEEDARKMHPRSTGDEGYCWEKHNYVWADSPDQVNVKYLGTAEPSMDEGVILASFNAG
jgi:hypothetical protein